MRIICTGNPEFGVASAIAERWPETTFVNRTDWGYDLNNFPVPSILKHIL